MVSKLSAAGLRSQIMWEFRRRDDLVTRIQVRPFLKWAGGKTQLLAELTARLPQQIKESGVIKLM